MASRPGTIHRKIAELLRQNPEGLTSGQIRAKLNIASHEQAQLDRRRRDLRKWFVIGKRQVGNEWVYTLDGEREHPALGEGINIRVRAAVLGRAHGRCQMCGRSISEHKVTLVVDHKIPKDWVASNPIHLFVADRINLRGTRRKLSKRSKALQHAAGY